MVTPLVSISCITYNQANYIREAIEGFLMQKTTFPFEIIIHDDASTDGTDQIIREYELKYPNLIFPVYQKENQWSKGIKRILITFVFPICKGKYIAFCEGDDYWTDPFKLQKQVDFLESNTDYGLVHTDYNILIKDEKGINEIQSYHSTSNKVIPSGQVQKSLIMKNFIATVTVVARKCFIDQYASDLPIKNIHKFIQGDYPLWLYIAGESNIGYINSPTCSYRVLESSISHSKLKKKKIAFLLTEYQIKIAFIIKYRITDLALYWQLVKEFPFRLWAQFG